MKMRAVLRYRRLPFEWRNDGRGRDIAIAAGLPPVIPVLRFPDGTLLNDSTPLIEELERRHRDKRSLVPDDPGQAFLAFLIEVRDLLQLCGDTYLPFLAANAHVIAEGRDSVSVTLRGRPYEQATFRYQAKCDDALRRRFAKLSPPQRARLEPVLEETGCLSYLVLGV
jgi:glutathione S-transferase